MHWALASVVVTVAAAAVVVVAIKGMEAAAAVALEGAAAVAMEEAIAVAMEEAAAVAMEAAIITDLTMVVAMAGSATHYFKSNSRKGIFVALERPKTEMVEKHPRNLFMC